MTRFIGGPFSQKQIQERLVREIASRHEHHVQYWPVFSLADGDFAGCCGLHSHKPAEKMYELGFHFLPAQWGKGLALESARAVIRFAFDSLGSQKLFAGHHRENQASRNVLEKLGFHFTHDETYPGTGKLHRCYLLESSP